jgi:hypothetical protein
VNVETKYEPISPAEALRTPKSVMEPDPRNAYFGFYPPSLEERHKDIAALVLNFTVPEKVEIQFETARNLYLYAWYVYRFHMVAAKQAYATLELGLRTALPPRLPEPYQRRQAKNPMLRGMLRYAIDQGLLRNEGFRRWHAIAVARAKERTAGEARQAMIDQGLESIKVDNSEPLIITEEDRNWDLLQTLIETIPSLRNELAHGSSMLTNQVLGNIELVAEILNQLYPNKID